ncbi:hypothetical protein ACFORL_01560 [Legionella dresdenensis]|uniref:Uncharacterized protein n=1 Tax=Legionella dresdenensis TaxID=450200 RepID=A0ABV8CCE6_9GAMM
MQPHEWEIIILKPTRAFITFLASQLPEVKIPSLKQLQIDNTAYAIKKQVNDEETLNEIERHFAFMFKNEIHRAVGKNAYNRIEGSFLDFLCCFKFELHSHVAVLEQSFNQGKQLLRIKPRSVLLKRIRAAVEEQASIDSVLEKIDVSHLADNATVIIKNFDQIAAIDEFVQAHYQPLYEAEMARMCDKAEFWPKLDSYQAFNQYFTVEIHTQLIHLK